METNKILQADYLDIIYDNRNKNYGGYELRKHYKRRAAKALGIMLGSLILAAGTPYLLGLGNHGKDVSVAAANRTDETIIREINLPPKKIASSPPPEQPAKTHNSSIAKTIQSTEPVIEKNNDVKPDVKPPKIEDMKDAIAGPVTNDGNGGHDIAKTIDKPNGPAGNNEDFPNGVIGGSDTKEAIANATDVTPEYPGGMKALLEYLQRNIRYPNEARENQIQGKVTVRFVVNKEGKIEGAEVLRGIGYGCDKEALRVVNAMKTWKPGQVKGKPVKAYYTLPITFRLDQ